MNTRVANPPEKPTVIFDGDCGFCRRWIASWQAITGDRVEYCPAQDKEFRGRFPEISDEAIDRSIQFIETDGTVFSGAEAVFRALSCAPDHRWPLWLYEHIPGARLVTEGSYAFVARNRMLFSKLTRWFLPAQPSTYFLTRSIFLRGLGLVYLAAFLSLYPQIIGLVGAKGITPAHDLMLSAHEQLHGAAKWISFPTLCWISDSDASLRVQCGLGILLSIMLVAGLFPVVATIALWLLWLSLTVACDVFLGFQWENLLLETGLVSIFLAPLSWRMRSAERPSLMAIWLIRWLLFRLMFESGAVKLLSGDPTWHNLTALKVHFQTQPLPTWIAWHAHQLPDAALRAATFVMFVIEFVAAVMALGPRWMRALAFAPLVALQIGILLTGNYAYFNWLTILLCIPLLDDDALKPLSPANWFKFSRARAAESFATLTTFNIRAQNTRRIFLALFTILIALVTILQLGFLAGVRKFPDGLLAFYRFVYPFRSINQYGLFANMTTERPEIILEGSDDAENWREYEFKYKPGDPKAPLKFIAPHQPRLDWQMWFAALGSYRENPWFLNLCARLFEGSPSVLELLGPNPFPEHPPKLLRAQLYVYRFSTRAEHRATGQWWIRQYRGIYLPAISAKELQPAESKR